MLIMKLLWMELILGSTSKILQTVDSVFLRLHKHFIYVSFPFYWPSVAHNHDNYYVLYKRSLMLLWKSCTIEVERNGHLLSCIIDVSSHLWKTLPTEKWLRNGWIKVFFIPHQVARTMTGMNLQFLAFWNFFTCFVNPWSKAVSFQPIGRSLGCISFYICFKEMIIIILMKIAMSICADINHFEGNIDLWSTFSSMTQVLALCCCETEMLACDKWWNARSYIWASWKQLLS